MAVSRIRHRPWSVLHPTWPSLSPCGRRWGSDRRRRRLRRRRRARGSTPRCLRIRLGRRLRRRRLRRAHADPTPSRRVRAVLTDASRRSVASPGHRPVVGGRRHRERRDSPTRRRTTSPTATTRRGTPNIANSYRPVVEILDRRLCVLVSCNKFCLYRSLPESPTTVKSSQT